VHNPLDHVHLGDLVRLVRSEDFVAEPVSVPAVRRFIRWCCETIGIDPDVCELLASELATNAVNHASTSFRVTFAAMRGQLTRVEVRDWSLALPEPRLAGPEDAGGRGFELVEALAAEWHVDVDPAAGCKVICFSLMGDDGEFGSALQGSAPLVGGAAERRSA
jgi:hypothetical protein